MELKWLARYNRQMKAREGGYHICWCYFCDREFAYIRAHPLIGGKCSTCRKVKDETK
jgi:hypothetical protein